MMRMILMIVIDRWAIASQIIEPSHAVMNANEIGRCSRTDTGWAHWNGINVRTQKSAHSARFTHGLARSRNNVGMIMFHSAGKPLNQRSSVS